MKVSAIHCKNCETTIYSRCRHDVRSCHCFKNRNENLGIVIDGGREYVKVTATPDSDYEFLHLEIGEVSLVDLYRDWNAGTNKYGIIDD